jgi:hypothetical protein
MGIQPFVANTDVLCGKRRREPVSLFGLEDGSGANISGQTKTKLLGKLADIMFDLSYTRASATAQ